MNSSLKVKFRHVGIVIRDLKKSLIFWCDILGFRIIKQVNEEGSYIDHMLGLKEVKVTTTKISDKNNNIIELLHFKSHHDHKDWQGKPYSTGLTHIALTVVNLKNIIKKLKDQNMLECDSPIKSPDGKVLVVYAKCIEGLLIELVEEL